MLYYTATNLHDAAGLFSKNNLDIKRRKTEFRKIK